MAELNLPGHVKCTKAQYTAEMTRLKAAMGGSLPSNWATSLTGAAKDAAYAYANNIYFCSDTGELFYMETKYATQGPQGTQGRQGPAGPQGPQGPKGQDGTSGGAGAQGRQGPQGPKGGDGTNGSQGPQGPKGAQGPTGTGAQGPTGPQGPMGTGINVKGTKDNVSQLPSTGCVVGDAYLIGGVLYIYVGSGGNVSGRTDYVNGGSVQGPAGAQGAQGRQGPAGSNGTGSQGPQGPAGTGSQGRQGPQGPAGSNGTGSQGPKGPQGSEGPQGPMGVGINVKGTKTSTSQLPSSGSVGDAYLIDGVLYIYVGSGGNVTGRTDYVNGGSVQGPTGAQGRQGPQGPKGGDGTNGSQGPQGPAGPTGTGSQGRQGTQGRQGPAGPQGPQGPKGQDGISGGAGAQGRQGPQGPKGGDGTNGSQGPQGPKGAQGPQGPTGTPYFTSGQGNETSSGDIGTSYNVYAPAFFEASDDRLKTYDGDLDNLTLEDILNIPLRKFFFNADESKKIHIGTSAQSLEEILPELVSTSEKTGFKAVQYDKLAIVALQAVKLLKQELDELKERL